MSDTLLAQLGIQYPIIQAPMAGTSTVALAAAVCNAGGLGSLGLGSSCVDQARLQITALRQVTTKPFNVNFFCHRTLPDSVRKNRQWLEVLQPYFAEFSTDPPESITSAYASFVDNHDMLSMLLAEKPPVVSFHFGLPSQAFIDALQQAGITLLGCATNLAEARTIASAGLDGVIAQGYEAGGHRGVFEPERDNKLGLFGLLQLLRQQCPLPVIAAGGIMHGQAIAQVLQMGASAAQLGTAFILCPESAADTGYRTQLRSSMAYETDVTSVISGRPARGLINRMHRELGAHHASLPGYPVAYSAAKALHAAASQQGCHDFAPYWAGQGAPLARELPAESLMAELIQEWQQATRAI